MFRVLLQKQIYAIEIHRGIILTEELYRSTLNNNSPELIFERKTTVKGKTSTRFHQAFEKDNESRVLQKVIEKTLAKPDMPLLPLLANLENEFLEDTTKAFEWFNKNLCIIYPNSKPVDLIYLIEQNKSYKNFAEQLMRSFNTGIQNLKVESKPLSEVLGKKSTATISKMTNNLKEQELRSIFIKDTGEKLVITKEKGILNVKNLLLEHHPTQTTPTYFNIEQESDGTHRLLDYIPVLKSLLDEKKVYVIDENLSLNFRSRVKRTFLEREVML